MISDKKALAAKKKARLSKAAPDLLKACLEALWAVSGAEYDPDRFERAGVLCREAITKATGKAPVEPKIKRAT